MKIEAKETNVAGVEKLFIHSDELATVNSKGLLEVKGQQGTKHSNKAEEYEVLESFSETNTIVYFRPKDTWRGEFGFDWLREQNGFITDKVNYSRMVGKYYKHSDQTMVNSIIPNNQYASNLKIFYIDDDNKWYVVDSSNNPTICNFKQDPQYETKNNKGDNTFEKLAQSFKHFNFSQKEITNQNGVEEEKYNIFPYYRSYIALFPATENYGTNTAEIDLHIKFLDGEKPDYLLFKIDNFDLTKCEHQNIGIDRVKIDNPREIETIKICCKNKENFTRDKNIKVYAVKKQSNGEVTEHLAGCITMMAPIIKTLDVAVVSVKVDQLGGNPTPNWEGLFKMILGQALIKVNIKKEVGGNKIQINLSDIDGFRAKFNISNGVIGKTDGLDTDLNRLFNKDYHNLYGKYLLLYFLDVHGPATIQGSIAGYAPINLGRTVLFNGHTKETITHETLHALSLPHSFFYREGLMYLDNNTAKYMDSYVYEAMATDNLMDYSHFPVDLSGNRRTPIDRIQIWMWQWKIIRSHRLINNTFISK
jgi:putative rhs element vgr protein